MALRNSIVATGLGVSSAPPSPAWRRMVWRASVRGAAGTRLLFIGGLVVPVQLIILPLFIMFRQTGILGDLRR